MDNEGLKGMEALKITLSQGVAGKQRLFNWPDLAIAEREDKADEVMNTFIGLAQAANFNCQWKPRNHSVVFYEQAGYPLPEDGEELRAKLVGMINEAYKAAQGVDTKKE